MDLISQSPLSEVHNYIDNGLWKVSPIIQYLFWNYFSALPNKKKKCLSFGLFCLLLNCMPELIFMHLLLLRLIQGFLLLF